MTPSQTPSERIGRLRANLLEARRFVASHPRAVQGFIDGAVLDLDVLRDELDRPARTAEFDALMMGGMAASAVADSPAEPEDDEDGPLVGFPEEPHSLCYRVGCFCRSTRIVHHPNGATSYQCEAHAPEGSEPIIVADAAPEVSASPGHWPVACAILGVFVAVFALYAAVVRR